MKATDSYLLGVDALVATTPSAVEEADEAADVANKAAEEASLHDAASEGRRLAKSVIPGVSDEAWTDFVFAVKTAGKRSVSASNCFGMFEMRVKRLADFGVVKDLSCTRSTSGRMVWEGKFVAPLTRDEFLGSAPLQYRVFCDSMKDYLKRLRNGQVALPEGGLPTDVSVSGALAVLHRCGPNGLVTWADESRRFPDTVALFNRANGIF